MVWELPPSNLSLYTYLECSLCYFTVYKKKPLQKVYVLKFYCDTEFEDSTPVSHKIKKLAVCSYCLIYHCNFHFYHRGSGCEYKNSQHSCQHNDRSKDNTKLTVTTDMKMELCKILGFGSNAVKDSIFLGYVAAPLGHWYV
jgi:hypothetical protein